MPTKKPYTASARIKQYDKPTRRVPPEGTVVGQIAIALAAVVDEETGLRDVDIVASKLDGEDVLSTSAGITLWLALGVALAERATGPLQQLFFQTVLGTAASVLENPAAMTVYHRIAESVTNFLAEESESAINKQAKLTSTEGTN